MAKRGAKRNTAVTPVAVPVMQSALAVPKHQGPTLAGAADVTLAECEARGQFVIRGDLDEGRFASRVGEALEIELPVSPNTVNSTGDRHVFWMGPKEWLAVMSPRRADKLRIKLEQKLRKHHAAVVDVGHSRVVFGLRGRRARDVLMKGCAIDLHPREFGQGQCVQTRLARCHILLHQLDETPAYEMYVHRSFARYAWAWLADATLEYAPRTAPN